MPMWCAEGLAVRILAEKGLDRGIKRALEDCLAEGDRILNVKKLTKAAREPWGEMNDRFHKLLLESTSNGALIDSLSRTTNIPYSSSRVVHWFEEDDLEGLYQLRFTHSHHHAIYNAICMGEGYRAEMAMRAHIGFTADHIRAKYFDGTQQRANQPNVIEIHRFHPGPPAADTLVAVMNKPRGRARAAAPNGGERTKQ